MPPLVNKLAHFATTSHCTLCAYLYLCIIFKWSDKCLKLSLVMFCIRSARQGFQRQIQCSCISWFMCVVFLCEFHACQFAHCAQMLLLCWQLRAVCVASVARTFSGFSALNAFRGQEIVYSPFALMCILRLGEANAHFHPLGVCACLCEMWLFASPETKWNGSLGARGAVRKLWEMRPKRGNAWKIYTRNINEKNGGKEGMVHSRNNKIFAA